MKELNYGNTLDKSGQELEAIDTNDVLSFIDLNRPLREMYEDNEVSYQLLQSVLKTIYGNQGSKIIPNIYEEFNKDKLLVETIEKSGRSFLRIPLGVVLSESEKTAYGSDRFNSFAITNRPNYTLFERELAKALAWNIGEFDNYIKVRYNFSKKQYELIYNYLVYDTYQTNKDDPMYSDTMIGLINQMFDYFCSYIVAYNQDFNLEETIDITEVANGDYTLYYRLDGNTNSTNLSNSERYFIIDSTETVTNAVKLFTFTLTDKVISNIETPLTVLDLKINNYSNVNIVPYDTTNAECYETINLCAKCIDYNSQCGCISSKITESSDCSGGSISTTISSDNSLTTCLSSDNKCNIISYAIDSSLSGTEDNSSSDLSFKVDGGTNKTAEVSISQTQEIGTDCENTSSQISLDICSCSPTYIKLCGTYNCSGGTTTETSEIDICVRDYKIEDNTACINSITQYTNISPTINLKNLESESTSCIYLGSNTVCRYAGSSGEATGTIKDISTGNYTNISPTINLKNLESNSTSCICLDSNITCIYSACYINICGGNIVATSSVDGSKMITGINGAYVCASNYWDTSLSTAVAQCKLYLFGANGICALNTITGTITCSNNIVGGSAGALLYQSAANTTATLSRPSSSDSILTATSSSGPSWTAKSSICVACAGQVQGGTNGQVLYSNGTNSYWGTAPSTPTCVACAGNIAGGSAGALLYQSAANTTASLDIGTSGQVLVSDGSSPKWCTYNSFSASATTSTIYFIGSTSNSGTVTSAYYNASSCVDGSGNMYATSYTATSARSKKKDIAPTTHEALKEINDIEIVDFKFKNDPKETPRVGFIADDTDEIFSVDKQHFDINNTVGMLLKAVQELSQKNKELEERIKKLE